MNPHTLQQFADQWLTIERGGDGAFRQRERLQELANLLLTANSKRDIVEIGCLNGSTTQLLAATAHQFGRKVIAIDPWKVGTQNCAGGEYDNFCKAIEPFKNSVEVVRLRSDDPAVLPHIPKNLALAFVDGLHEYETALQDILMVQHAEVVVVDDITWSAELRRAVEEACFQTRYGRRLTPLFVSNYREAYLI